MEIQGNLLVSKLANFAQYSLLSNLPALDPVHGNPQDQYHFGIARSGLAHGSAGRNHQVRGVCATYIQLNNFFMLVSIM